MKWVLNDMPPRSAILSRAGECVKTPDKDKNNNDPKSNGMVSVSAIEFTQ